MSRRDLGYVSGYTTVQAFANVYGTASGGTAVTISGVNYQYVAISSTGSFTPTSAGLFDVLIFGGGAASPQTTIPMGGAGGGGICQQTIYLPAGAHTVVVGAGGSTYTVSTAYQFGAGSSSQIGAIPTAISALGGTSNMSNATGTGVLFTGSGMGSYASQTNSGIDSIQGYKGGNSTTATNAGGGGGAGGAGGNAPSTNVGGTGGNGYDVSSFIGGSALYKGAGGGGAGTVTGGTAGLGGVAGSTGAGIAASANSAGGAGGSNNAAGANGGSGIIYIRWKV